MDRLEMMNRVIRYIRTTDFGNPNLEYSEEMKYIEEEHLEALIERDKKVRLLKQRLQKAEDTIDKQNKEIAKQTGLSIEQINDL